MAARDEWRGLDAPVWITAVRRARSISQPNRLTHTSPNAARFSATFVRCGVRLPPRRAYEKTPMTVPALKWSVTSRRAGVARGPSCAFKGGVIHAAVLQYAMSPLGSQIGPRPLLRIILYAPTILSRSPRFRLKGELQFAPCWPATTTARPGDQFRILYAGGSPGLSIGRQLPPNLTNSGEAEAEVD